jgi:NADH-quinone oxidoreductase subunit J
VGLVAGLALGGLFITVYVKGQSLFSGPLQQLSEKSNTQEIGQLLYQDYMFSFEIASLLLLVAIIGAVVMAKKRI